MADDRDDQDHAPEKQPAKPAPERAARAPELDPVADVVEVDHLLFGVIAFADHAEVFHLEAGGSELLHRGVGLRMICEYGNDGAVLVHVILVGLGCTRQPDRPLSRTQLPYRAGGVTTRNQRLCNGTLRGNALCEQGRKLLTGSSPSAFLLGFGSAWWIAEMQPAER